MGAPDGMVASVRANGTAVMDPRSHDRETLRTIIAQWNANRLDLFELSEPDENMQFYGVMRFYFQDDAEKIATKCVRVCSVQTVREIAEILIEKFRPDMRMLSLPHFGIYEVHANGEERKLKNDEKPLLVQLNWHKDDREGRFLLKNEDHVGKIRNGDATKKSSRTLSKEEKKEIKKKEKEEKLKQANEALGITYEPKESDAERLFKQLPETSFHRSISNPEAVMRRRRQQKLEKKLQQFKSTDGGPDTGGTLKIFGESINPDVPYKTLLLSVNDTAEAVIKQTLEKYGLERDDYSKYCLVQAILPVGSDAGNVDPRLLREKILTSSDCPLQILMRFPAQEGILVFNLKKRSELSASDHKAENGVTRPLLSHNPYLVEILPNGLGQAVQIFPGITEVGNDHLRLGAANFFHLNSPDVLPIHCVFNRLEATVTVYPSAPNAFVAIDGRKIENRAIVQNGSAIRIGQCHVFRFFSPPSFSEIVKPVPLSRDKLQLPLTSVALPKRSPDGDLRKHVALQMDTTEHDIMDTGSSVHSHRSSPDVQIFGRQNGGLSSKLPILPATIEFREDHEDIFLTGVVLHPNPAAITFKLSPAYVLYMAARYRASTNFRPEIVPIERAHLLTKFLHKVASVFMRVVEEHDADVEYLAFWLANASELHHLLKLDRHMSPYGADAHDILADCIHEAFHHLTLGQQKQLAYALPSLLADVPSDSGWGDVLNILSSTMSLLRRCRLNAALTIQHFSRLFHFINVWLFNTFIQHPERYNRHFGNWLRAGLDHVLQWAEKQGLELAADCHLCKIIQVINLLDIPKDDTFLTNFASACYRLNSVQVRFILEHYEPEQYEYITEELIEQAVSIAKNLVDEPAQLNRTMVQLEEDHALPGQFLIPEDGYSVDVVCGIPAGLHEFLDPLSRAKICEMSVHPFSQGVWTVYLTPSSGNHSPAASFESRVMHPTQNLPNVVEVSFLKGSSGIGLSIVAARGANQEKQGIYVKSVVRGGAADLDGRLYSGDQLLKVNGKGLVGVSQDRAAELIAQSGPTVHLEVLKQGAFAHGLATMLNSPSPPPTAVKSPAVPSANDYSSMSLTRDPNPSFRNGYVSQNFTEFMAPENVKFRASKPPVDGQVPHPKSSPPGYQPAQPLTVRSPSPVRDLIASQMHAQRDRIRQEAKMLEMEDELRRRREQIQQSSIRDRSPQSMRPPPAVVARPLGGAHRSVSMERMDRSGKLPGEKRVQWAVDNPSNSPSPTIQLHPVNVQQMRPPTDQVVRVAVPPNPVNPTPRAPVAQEIQSWSLGFKERGENGGSPTAFPWNCEENQQIKEKARRLLDDEIAALHSRPNLTEGEQERLRAMLLERDFKRRAEEEKMLHHEDEEEEAEDDDEQMPSARQVPVSVTVPKVTVPKTAPHLHHPVAAAAPDVYRTRQQEDYDQFVRRQEAHAITAAIQRSREHLNTTNGVQHVRVQESTYPLPAAWETSPVMQNGAKQLLDNGNHAEMPVTVTKRQTAGMEIRNEVEAQRPCASAVVGVHEVYNDPRHKILNAKTRLPVMDDTSPEKLSFRDKMRMFASTVGEDPKDRVTASSKQRDLEFAFVSP